ncbi:MAG: hypothetical protein JRH13_14530 [Deltaproteobacteria bacterium]|nr:hypothetical protein [Deltaproteobacteria bacterium]MBW2017971.1 hypothetical protein [Deltaproteobacteria bacterium]MBW2130566.1 hypothetical protein [Deltaproteobacteria bacterium]MBW2305268.1 hypothetical protein [Deltaproteobacteria bacterium]
MNKLNRLESAETDTTGKGCFSMGATGIFDRLQWGFRENGFKNDPGE